MALYFLGRNTVGSDYLLARAVHGSNAIIIIGPYVAVAAAAEMAVLRLVWGRLPMARGWFTVLAGRLAWVAVLGATAMAAVFAASGALWPLGPSVLALPALVSLAGVVAWTAFGAAVGLVARQAVALPAALGLPFLLLALPQSWPVMWVRHLNGYLFDCCSTSEVLAPAAVAASLSVLLAFTVVCLSVAAVRLVTDASRAHRAALLGAGVSVISVLLAAVAAAPAAELGPMPTAPRATGALVCQDSVCVWPEDQGAAAANAAAWRRVRAQWLGAGLPLSKSKVAPTPTADAFGIGATATDPSQVHLSMATLLPRAQAGCEDDYSNARRNAALDRLTHWLATTSGAPADQLPPLMGSAPIASDREAAAVWRTVRGCSS